MDLKTKINSIIRILKRLYPDAKCSLNYRTPLQLLIATILSAQCTDARVNIVTKELFKKYKTAKDFADAPVEELEEMIRSTGFYRSKAKSILETCLKIVSEYRGKVPKDMEKLLSLRGVARKTANVVLGNAYNIPTGIVVDTHMIRISNRLGLTKNKNPVKIENDLMELVPKKDWTMFSHWIIWHGRKVCKAQKPLCDNCKLQKYCDYYKKNL